MKTHHLNWKKFHRHRLSMKLIVQNLTQN